MTSRCVPGLLVVLTACAAPTARSAGDSIVADCVANWLEQHATAVGEGVEWPVDVDAKVRRTSSNLYSGSLGVILFFLEHHASTGDTRSLRLAEQAGRQVRNSLDDEPAGKLDQMSKGLYTGVAGLAYTFAELHRTTGLAADLEFAQTCLDCLSRTARPHGEGCDWGPVTDIISGTAGIGLTLLWFAEELGSKEALDLARRAGTRMLALADRGGSGDHYRWAMQKGYLRRMPNFSHGTAGVSYFLARLYQCTDEPRFRAAARGGAAYLSSITTGGLIYHNDQAKGLHYLSWCHGPPGTARLFALLHAIDGEAGHREWIVSAAKALAGAGIPNQRTAGFWNNHGQCCGTAGVADFMLRVADLDGISGADALIDAMLEDLCRAARVRRSAGRLTMSWTGAEHRVRPGQLSTQTGFTQGAAGIGLVFLHAIARRRGVARRIVLPDARWR